MRAYVRFWAAWRVMVETPSGEWIDVNRGYARRHVAEAYVRKMGYTLVTQEEIEDEKPRAR